MAGNAAAMDLDLALVQAGAMVYASENAKAFLDHMDIKPQTRPYWLVLLRLLTVRSSMRAMKLAEEMPEAFTD